MSGISKKALWYTIGIIVSAFLGFYMFWAAIFYAWMNANGSWVPSKAELWSYGSLALAVMFFGLFIYFIAKVIKLRKAGNVKT